MGAGLALAENGPADPVGASLALAQNGPADPAGAELALADKITGQLTLRVQGWLDKSGPAAMIQLGCLDATSTGGMCNRVAELWRVDVAPRTPFSLPVHIVCKWLPSQRLDFRSSGWS